MQKKQLSFTMWWQGIIKPLFMQSCSKSALLTLISAMMCSAVSFDPTFHLCLLLVRMFIERFRSRVFKKKNQQPAAAEEEVAEQTTGELHRRRLLFWRFTADLCNISHNVSCSEILDAAFEWNQLVEPIREEINGDTALDFQNSHC